MKRTWVWIGLGLGLLVVVTVGLWVGFGTPFLAGDDEWGLASPPPVGRPPDAAPPDVAPERPPADADSPAERPAESMDSGADESVEVGVNLHRIRLPESGTLAFVNGDRQMGKAEYQFSWTEDGGIQLFSQGEFNIPVLPVSVKYRQQAQWNAQLRPTYYATEFKGPLGLGNRQVAITVDDQFATLTSGEVEDQVFVPVEDLAMLGMFSSYAILPQLVEGDRLAATALILSGVGGEPGSGQNEANPAIYAIPLFILQGEPLTVMRGGEAVQIERMALAFGQERSVGFHVLMKDGRWVGLLGMPQEEGRELFKVYRTDLFPDGFEIVSGLEREDAPASDDS